MAKKKRKSPVRNLIEGKPVINSEESLTLAIRTSDIRHAVATAPDACAAAIACVRQFRALSARVYPSRTFIEYPEYWVRYVTPNPLRREIVAIDGGGKFHPGLYTLMRADAPGNAATGEARGGSPVVRSPTPHKRRSPTNIHTARGHVIFGSEPLATPATVAELIKARE